MSVLDDIERQESVKKLADNGYKKLVEVLMFSDEKVYTKKGRLNKSGLCRALGWKPKQLEEALVKCREILS